MNDSIKPKGTIFFSPHSDDIAFSVGGTIALKKFPFPYTLITVFGSTTFLGIHGIKNIEEATSKRMIEDERFAKSINAKLYYFNFPDILLRNKNNVNNVGIKPMITRKQILQIRKTCLVRIKETNPEVIVIPAGIGNNFDHIIVKCIIMSIMKNKERLIKMYEDQPYTSFFGEKIVATIVNATTKIAKSEVNILKNVLSCKIKFVKKYQSQLHDDKIEKITSYAYEINARHGGERIWVV